jgi:hypothetical protein
MAQGQDRENEVTLPYESATTGKNAVAETQRILRAFGAASFGVMEDFAAGTVIVQFEYRGRRVSIQASSKGYAAAWLRAHPWSPRMRCSLQDHERKAIEQGQISVYSILRDWVKGQVTAVETGMLSFEGAFLGQILLDDGRTVIERLKEMKLLGLGS